MPKYAWKPEDLVGKLVWAWNNAEDRKRIGILFGVSGDIFPYELDDGNCFCNICPLTPEEHPELFYKPPSKAQQHAGALDKGLAEDVERLQDALNRYMQLAICESDGAEQETAASAMAALDRITKEESNDDHAQT